MSYNTIVDMANSQSLLARVAACAATLGNSQSRTWAANNLLQLVATAPPALQTAWDQAGSNPNALQDTGRRTDVITDTMIDSAVVALKAVQLGTQGWPAA